LFEVLFWTRYLNLLIGYFFEIHDQVSSEHCQALSLFWMFLLLITIDWLCPDVLYIATWQGPLFLTPLTLKEPSGSVDAPLIRQNLWDRLNAVNVLEQTPAHRRSEWVL
jgi:hypothetical protein